MIDIERGYRKRVRRDQKGMILELSNRYIIENIEIISNESERMILELSNRYIVGDIEVVSSESERVILELSKEVFRKAYIAL